MASRVVMPKLSDTMEEGRILRWLKKEGDPIETSQALAEVETDKATVEMEAYTNGTVLKLITTEGQFVKVGDLIAVIGAAGEYISPYNDPAVIAGAGTTAVEVLEEQPSADALLVPTGGGGLLSGVAIAAHAIAPGIRVIGVEAEHNPAFTLALERGVTRRSPLARPLPRLGGNLEAGSMTFQIVRDRVDAMVTVSEEEVERAMRFLLETEHLVVEGAGAVAVAAILSRKVDPALRVPVALVTGANVDLSTLLAVFRRAG